MGLDKFYFFLVSTISSMFLFSYHVYAIEKIEGGNITIDGLGKIIKKLATQIQVFGIIASFMALAIFVLQFIIGDDEMKQRRKKTILYTLSGVILLILIPSIINFLIDTFTA